MANLELPFGIKVLNPTPVDAKYLNDGVPYVSIAEVNATIGAGIRHTGLTVNISGVEYWYAAGIGDGDLVVKSAGGSGSGERIEKEYTQASHGFVVGDVVSWSGTSFIKSIADGSQSAEVVGFVTEVADGNNFTVVFSGYIEGISGLTLSSNTTYFLSTTVAGGLTTTQPSAENEVSKPILTTFTTDDALVFQYREFIISSGTSGGGVTGITNITNIGVGEDVFESLVDSGQTAQFRTIIGSGNTTVSTSGDTIIVNSEGGGSSKQVFVTTASDVAVLDTSINTIYVASGTTGYTLPVVPSTGAEITFVDELGTAGTTNIIIDGNGNNIRSNVDTNALINTNFGSMTIIFNGNKWNVTAFVS